MIFKTCPPSETFPDFPVVGIFLFEGEVDGPKSLACLPKETAAHCLKHLQAENFRARKNTFLKIPFAEEALRTVCFVGLGKREEFERKSDDNPLREGAFRFVRSAAEKGLARVGIFYPFPSAHNERASVAIAEGAALGCYRFNKYKSQSTDESKEDPDLFAAPEEVLVAGADPQGLERGRILGDCQNYARNLANEPGNVIHPEDLAYEAKRLCEEFGLECEIWDEERLFLEGMGALHAVGKGSANKPFFIRATYTPAGASRGHVALVGKGITFDSGGLSLKPGDSMATMKGDKSGACSVLGALRAAAMLALPTAVTAFIGAAENMPDGGAYRVDDILRAYNSKTIEVKNTDAEGRLALADALAYASAHTPAYDAIVDVATLTGAIGVALGQATAGLFTNDAALGDKLLAAAAHAGERCWKMPLDDDFLRKKIASPIADVQNSAGRYGGAITAAMFLEAFVGPSIPWAHLDIASVDFVDEPYAYYVKGASGFATRTLATYLADL